MGLAMTPLLADVLASQDPCLALAPMQDITNWDFWKLTASYGGATIYFTEYFRVTQNTRPNRAILRSIVENPTGRPAVAQMIGNDIPELVRFAKELQRHPVAGIDLNLGCPAPVVYKKCAGGGLLRDPARVDAILGALRDAISTVPFTVKTRLGFTDPAEFDGLLPIFQKHSIDLLSVHGRTVREGYRDIVHYERIADAVQAMPCPVLANGSVDSPQRAMEILAQTGARGLMIGRAAVRSPWLFNQIRTAISGGNPGFPTGREVHDYIRRLYAAMTTPDVSEFAQVQRMKKYLNFVGVGISPEFLHAMRRCSDVAQLESVCSEFLAHDEPMLLNPVGTPRFE